MTIEDADPEIVVVKAEAVQPTATSYQQSTATAPPPTLPPQKERVGFDILCCGDDVKSGIRIKPGRTHFAIKLCGNTNILLPQDPPPAGAHYKFFSLNLCGSLLVRCPNNTNVVLRRISLCGNRSMDTDDDNVDSATSETTVTLTVIQLCGDVLIKHHGRDSYFEGEE